MASELTPEQRAAKDAVKLPYQHTGEETGASHNLTHPHRALHTTHILPRLHTGLYKKQSMLQ